MQCSTGLSWSCRNGRLDYRCTRRQSAMDELERRFDGAMMEIYERAGREVGYWATRYLQMLRARGGLETARRLLNARATSDGYARLRDAGRLDLTVEAYSLRPEFQALFTPEELNMARDRLEYFGRPLRRRRSRSMSAGVDGPAGLRPQEPPGPPDRISRSGGQLWIGCDPAVEAWTAKGLSPGFASAVLELIGRNTKTQAEATGL